MESRKSAPAPQAEQAPSIMCHISIKNSHIDRCASSIFFSCCFMCIFLPAGHLFNWL